MINICSFWTIVQKETGTGTGTPEYVTHTFLCPLVSSTTCSPQIEVNKTTTQRPLVLLVTCNRDNSNSPLTVYISPYDKTEYIVCIIL